MPLFFQWDDIGYGFRARAQGYSTVTLPGAAAPTPSMPRFVLVKRLLWQLLRIPQGTAAISARDSYWWHVSRCATAVVTDRSQEAVRVRRLDQSLMRTLSGRGLRLAARLVREQPGVRRRYHAALPSLTSRQNWQRLFDTDDPGSTLGTFVEFSRPTSDDQPESYLVWRSPVREGD